MSKLQRAIATKIRRGQTPEPLTHVRYVIELPFAGNDSRCKVNDFLDSLTVFSGAVAVNGQAISDV